MPAPVNGWRRDGGVRGSGGLGVCNRRAVQSLAWLRARLCHILAGRSEPVRSPHQASASSSAHGGCLRGLPSRLRHQRVCVRAPGGELSTGQRSGLSAGPSLVRDAVGAAWLHGKQKAGPSPSRRVGGGDRGAGACVALSREIWDEYLSFRSLVLWMRKLRTRRGGVDPTSGPHCSLFRILGWLRWSHIQGCCLM